MSQQINLFNPAFEKQKQALAAATMAQGLLLILLMGAGLAWYGTRQVTVLERAAAQSKAQLAVREARRTKVLADYPVRAKDPAIGHALAQAEAERSALLAAQKALQGGSLGNTQGYSAYFRAFANRKVDGLWLTGVSIAGADSQIGLQGRALQAALVPAYINALGKDPVLRGKTFARLDIAASVPKMPATTAQPAAAPVAPSAPLSSLPALAGLPPDVLQALGASGSKAIATASPAAVPVPVPVPVPAAPAARQLPLSYVEFDLQSTAASVETGASAP
ncbi:MSHA biogenesis protein MshA [Janthinobacterium sp. PC23-8]|uniref:MSHA biogenesis protein MshA n=1 Tax=Janthinobacterium sp. PC23-8 TaxID=2012679 RepID=UPI0015960713|nr:MSHA biogenesis protein MshA [Janthinobacterium sp. PC23-8]